MTVYAQLKPTKEERKKAKSLRRKSGSPFKSTRFRSEDYREFVRTHPCSIEGRNGHRCFVECDMRPDGSEWNHVLIDAAHAEGFGMGIKASDALTLSLCRAAHMEQHAIGWERFEAKYEINRYEVCCRLLEEWISRRVA